MRVIGCPGRCGALTIILSTGSLIGQGFAAYQSGLLRAEDRGVRAASLQLTLGAEQLQLSWRVKTSN